jgi:hypothetical protein
MSAIGPTHATAPRAEQLSSRRWRRRQIVATYSSYVAVVVLISIRAHVPLSSGARGTLTAAFGFAAVVFIVSLVWLVAPSVQYGLHDRSYRRPARGELKALRDRGVSAKEAQAMFIRPADERQRAIRERARAVSYQILGPVIVVAVLYLIFGPRFIDHPWLPSTEIEQVWLLAGFAMLFSTLPAAVIAWSEPEPVPDDVT